MKKLLSALLVSTMILSFASCGDEEPTSKKSKKSSSSSAVSDEENTAESDEDETTAEAPEETTAEETTTEAPTEEKTTEAPTEEDTTEDTTETPTEDTTKDNENSNVDLMDYVKTDAPQPALWKASDPETGNEIYLMGTIHAVCEEKYSMPDYITEVYDKCGKIAFEIDPTELDDISQLQELLTYMIYQDGSTIKDHLSEKAYEKGKQLFTDMGAYNSLLDYYKPGFWINQFETSPILKIKNISTDGVDAKFAAMAKKDGKEILSIENFEIQAGAMVGYSDEFASYCLENVTDDDLDPQKYAESFAELYELWANGKIDEIGALNEEEKDELPEEYLDDYAEYMDIMLYDRNEGMAEKAAEYIENGGDLFFMVGAMHYTGDKGVTKLLEEKGYTVERLH